MKRSIPSFLPLLCMMALPAEAVTLARYQFTGNYGNSATPPAGISSAGAITLASGLSGNTPGNNPGVGVSSNPANTLYIRSAIIHSSAVEEKTAATGIQAGDYFTFELTIAPGYTLDLNSVSASLWSSTAVPTDSYTSNLAIYYTTNGTALSSEAAAVKLGEVSTSGTTATACTFSDNLAGNEALTGTVQIHFVFWDPSGANVDNRVIRLDDIVVDGTLSTVPESSTVSLSSLVFLAPLLRRRRTA